MLTSTLKLLINNLFYKILNTFFIKNEKKLLKY